MYGKFAEINSGLQNKIWYCGFGHGNIVAPAWGMFLLVFFPSSLIGGE